ncbi:DeoR/GlpR family DNA-binding transcription regulator [Frondihabitans australicus]|uniref:Lactose phosphotransferase system repressor n=1 Tax=Frondihabitans australicus TaxID=386892 RepID=A0A495IG56_9MICO|nr:DeoR/GlpR family DNA-binding transcription regulator [Frondihabitans australicus]RKR74388.1 DeoR family transcriptional regulator [Frondihabitans australicus]
MTAGRGSGARSNAASERRAELLRLTRESGRLDAADAARLVGVSPETLRRDLRALEEAGLIRRSYGAAVPVESGAYETGLAYRETNHAAEKARIADAAARHLGEAQTIFLDEGYQTQLVAERLPGDRPLTILTSSLPVAARLSERPNVQLLLLGGRVRGNTLGTVDHWAADMLRQFVVDLAFVGANGVSETDGLTTPDPAVAMVKSAAVATSKRRIFVGASHKFGTSTFVRFAALTDFDVMITGTELSASAAGRFAAAGARLERV